ncbi:5-formyltetrahydrofolate cyclo-ligase [Geosporobacter subterraneus DSM 17957]|uniref:5-formyltetrahydrofolate cyclo-ligase n=2 Tax=Geosporobacter TaxID=390805 RepID=A0A1M6DAR7_9FIRM|nr:5-formyltetrahydrofolate cyclo-ligase [Geosporobacter subterraneus DSM 17957]
MMKKELRKETQNRRGMLSEGEILEKSSAIAQKLKAFPAYQAAQNVMVYIDFRGEVKTGEIIQDLISSHKRAIVPICVPKTREMILSHLKNPAEELAEGTFGVFEPKEEYIRPVAPDEIDLVIVPGVAFDRKGYRIGYGGGYYDRFFEKLPKKIPAVALAFDLQLVEKVPAEVFDQAVDYIITESEIIQCK